MDLPWERRADHRHLPPDVIAGLLRPVFPQAIVESAELLPEGKCNSNYRVTLAGHDEPVLLRVYGRDLSACEREAALHRRLAGDVPLAEMHHAGRIEDEHPLAYVVMAWVEGRHLGHWLPDASEGDARTVTRELGAILAAISSVTFDRAGFLGPDLTIAHPFENVVDAYLGYMEDSLFRQPGAEVLGEELARRLWAHMSAHRSLLEPARAHTHLTHCDFGPWNILVRETPAGPRVAAVLDWEFASSGSFLADIGNLFRRRNLMPPGRLPSLAEGFTERGGVLLEEWVRMARLFDMVALGGMSALGKERPALAEDLRRLVAEAIA